MFALVASLFIVSSANSETNNMSFLGGLANGLVGGAFEAYGAATGDKSATQQGHAITNPAVNLGGAINPGYSAKSPQVQAFYPGIQQVHAAGTPVNGLYSNATKGTSPYVLAAPAQKSDPGNTTPGGGYGGLSAGSGGSGYSSSFNPGNADAINASFDIGKNWYTGLQGQLDPQMQQQIGDTDQQYGDNLQSIQHQRDAAYTDLDNQGHVLNDQYGRSLNQLGNQVRNQLQGQSNALGVAGAGDSSAQNMLAYALSQMHNQQRGYMNQDLNHQLTQIASTRQADQNQFDDAARQLNDWKQMQYHQINQGFQNLRQNIMTSLANNEQARNNALQYAGQWAANQVQGVNQTLQDNLAQLSQRQAGPNVAVSGLQGYTAQNINPGTLDVSASLQNPVTPTDVAQVAAPLLPKKDPNAPINPAL